MKKVLLTLVIMALAVPLALVGCGSEKTYNNGLYSIVHPKEEKISLIDNGIEVGSTGLTINSTELEMMELGETDKMIEVVEYMFRDALATEDTIDELDCVKVEMNTDDLVVTMFWIPLDKGYINMTLKEEIKDKKIIDKGGKKIIATFKVVDKNLFKKGETPNDVADGEEGVEKSNDKKATPVAKGEVRFHTAYFTIDVPTETDIKAENTGIVSIQDPQIAINFLLTPESRLGDVESHEKKVKELYKSFGDFKTTQDEINGFKLLRYAVVGEDMFTETFDYPLDGAIIKITYNQENDSDEEGYNTTALDIINSFVITDKDFFDSKSLDEAQKAMMSFNNVFETDFIKFNTGPAYISHDKNNNYVVTNPENQDQFAIVTVNDTPFEESYDEIAKIIEKDVKKNGVFKSKVESAGSTKYLNVDFKFNMKDNAIYRSTFINCKHGAVRITYERDRDFDKKFIEQALKTLVVKNQQAKYRGD